MFKLKKYDYIIITLSILVFCIWLIFDWTESRIQTWEKIVIHNSNWKNYIIDLDTDRTLKYSGEAISEDGLCSECQISYSRDQHYLFKNDQFIDTKSNKVIFKSDMVHAIYWTRNNKYVVYTSMVMLKWISGPYLHILSLDDWKDHLLWVKVNSEYLTIDNILGVKR